MNHSIVNSNFVTYIITNNSSLKIYLNNIFYIYNNIVKLLTPLIIMFDIFYIIKYFYIIYKIYFVTGYMSY